MKKLFLIACALVFTFTSCDLKDEVEDAINNNIPPVEQEVSEDITIESAELNVDGGVTITKEITIDTTDINEKIDSASDSPVDIKDITLDDLEIKLAEGSEQTNLDFLDSLKLNISSGDGSETVAIDFGTIEKGVNSLKLPDGQANSILSLIQGNDVGELTIDVEMITNAAVENDIDLELISTLLADIELSIFD